MAATDGQITVAAARWADEGNYLREFVSKHQLPAAVKIIKGQYGGLGVPTLPSPGLQSTVLLVSAGKRQKIMAQAVKIKEGRRLVSIGPRLMIPDTYAGYFELLSEEGRAVRCIESVAELARGKFDEGFLVRESIRGVQAKSDSEGSIIPEGTRTVSTGELLLPSEEIVVPGSKNRYLKCLDNRGEIVLLSLEQRGRFSALAREDNISGVHTTKNLLSKRLPLTVRLVHGIAPCGLQSTSHFVPELRLLSMFEEDHVFALPLQKESHAVTSLPLAAPLKLLRARNQDQLRAMAEFKRLVDKSVKLVDNIADCIQVLDKKLGGLKEQSVIYLTEMKNGYLLCRNPSSELANKTTKHLYCRDDKWISIHSKYYDEVDQIYDYVRGVGPLSKNVRSHITDPSTSLSLHMSTQLQPVSDLAKTENPSIETNSSKIPQTEKHDRMPAVSAIRDLNSNKIYSHIEKSPPSVPKLYIKNGQSQRSRLLRQKSASPMKGTPSRSTSKSEHTFYSIKYKSLNNLQEAMELDGTLGSSHSGGQADSGEIVKEVEKRTRRLSRPRSLTNLVWDVKEQTGPSAIDKEMQIESVATTYRKYSKTSDKGTTQYRETLYL